MTENMPAKAQASAHSRDSEPVAVLMSQLRCVLGCCRLELLTPGNNPRTPAHTG